MPETSTIDDSRALAVRTELSVVTSAIEVALGVRELTTEFAARRATLIAAGQVFDKPPINDEEQEAILSAQRALGKLRTEVKKQADALKAPLNAARTKIIEIHDNGIVTIDKEEKRLQGLVNFRQQKLADERREAERLAEVERRRIADEAAAAERARLEAERQRLAAEIAAQNAELLKGKAKLKAQEEAAALAAKAAQAEDEAYMASLAAETPVPVEAVPVSDLPMAKELIDYVVIGKNVFEQRDSLVKFAAAHPRLVNIEIRRRDLLDELAAGRIISAPGIEIHKILSKLR
jgi:hypothetical protein